MVSRRSRNASKYRVLYSFGVVQTNTQSYQFAKLEMNLIVAYFLATFDYELTDGEGRSTTETPEVNMNCYVPAKPEIKVCLKYRRRPAAP
jgi:hypothetical protein